MKSTHAPLNSPARKLEHSASLFFKENRWCSLARSVFLARVFKGAESSHCLKRRAFATQGRSGLFMRCRRHQAVGGQLDS
ncbi:unnamed protein product [Caenorhabditis auriculariae]|uniref:Uncharacterized protein n=1 Tax=Caenorhabditis auriculariae TaxID=2777116 RepID=A0A8S1H5K2_9PELO|nr:unnamed protein product [Caenorhabditis auriculariae]